METLGYDARLEWSMMVRGLRVETPPRPPSEYAYVFKITRGRPF